MSSPFKLFVSIFLIPSVSVMAQTQSDVNNYPNNLGISINQVSFDRLVTHGIEIMKIEKSPNIQDIITIVRIYNTITFTDDLRQKNDTDKKFCDLFDFDEKYDKLFVTKLHARRSVGMGYYSERYKIYLGGLPDANSKYKIVKNSRTN